ncbi:hypothetical protein [Streptomyces sp. NPDC048385]|uniref:hypothetical protein n=1 Tax=Streptomyces sp. NPDC048385 TaxID=3155145 RepID=UPI00342AA324
MLDDRPEATTDITKQQPIKPSAGREVGSGLGSCSPAADFLGGVAPPVEGDCTSH